MKKDKREVSVIVPYRNRGGTFEYFLQMRDTDAKRAPNMYGLFGGGIDHGESPERAIIREIREELDLQLTGHEFFGQFEFMASIQHVYILEVGDSFESTITVHEGQYGRFLTLKEAWNNPVVLDTTALVLSQLEKHLKGIL